MKLRNEDDGQRRKMLEYSPLFESLRRQSQENMDSDEGIEERLNRSIQAEGAFSKMKDGMKFERFSHRRMDKVVASTILVAMEINLNKLDSKIRNSMSNIIRYRK